ncbi:carboxypeptidase-like regulatory domain-containing protein [Adhaeribacter terreus]|uniref:Carboxypeptidase-like regulatory domain-containing protein n=1 Tax=Adhaeribacter terreus TaxID=529703 RepID=A0ABW0E7V9_9BACT
MRNLTIFLFLILAGCSSQQLIQNKTGKGYEYEICVPYSGIESKIRNNLTKESINSDHTLIKGKIQDFSMHPVSFAVVEIKNLNSAGKTSTFSDSTGSYQHYLPTGNYKIRFLCPGYSEMIIDSIYLKSGQIQEIDVALGEASGFRTIGITSEKPLSKRKLSKMAKEYQEERRNEK